MPTRRKLTLFLQVVNNPLCTVLILTLVGFTFFDNDREGDACVPRFVPDAATAEAQSLVAEVELVQAKYKLSSLQVEDSRPSLEASGRLSGYELDAGRTLQMLSWADPGTRDLEGNPGNGRNYLVGSFTTDGECWEVQAEVGYPGAEGLTFQYYFASVPQEAVAEVRLNVDGLTDSDLSQLGVSKIGQFTVPLPVAVTVTPPTVSGEILVPADNAQVRMIEDTSGTVTGALDGHQLYVFNEFPADNRFFPQQASVASSGQWIASEFYIGGEGQAGEPFVLHLVDLGPVAVRAVDEYLAAEATGEGGAIGFDRSELDALDTTFLDETPVTRLPN